MTDSFFDYVLQDGVLTIIAPQTLDAATQPGFSSALERVGGEGAVQVRLDLSKTEFADSAGVGFISQLHKFCTAAGGGLKLICVSGQPLALLTSLKVGDHVEIET